MEDIRLKELPFVYNEREYRLRCNMAVLADIEEEFGNIPDIFEAKGQLNKMLKIMAIMMNEYADYKGWAVRVTYRDLGRNLELEDVPFDGIRQLITGALSEKPKKVRLSPQKTDRKPGGGKSNFLRLVSFHMAVSVWTAGRGILADHEPGAYAEPDGGYEPSKETRKNFPF